MTREEFDSQLRRVGADPETFWAEFNRQKRRKESEIEDYDSPGAFVDNGLSWASTDQGHEYWSGIKDALDKLTEVPVVTCCKWNGHPLYCNCSTKQRYEYA